MTPPPAPTSAKPACTPNESWFGSVVRVAATAALIGGYYFARGALQDWTAGDRKSVV